LLACGLKFLRGWLIWREFGLFVPATKMCMLLIVVGIAALTFPHGHFLGFRRAAFLGLIFFVV